MKVTPRDIAHEICKKYNVTLSKKEMDDLVSILRPLYLIRGKNVVTAGTVCDSLYYVYQGLLFETYRRDNIEITRHIMIEGDMFTSLESFITGAPAFQTISVFEPAYLYEIPRADLERLSATSFAFCQLRLAIYERFIIEADHWDYDMRFASAQQRYERALKSNPEVVLRSPMKRIASLLQMKPETLSRIRSQVHEDD